MTAKLRDYWRHAFSFYPPYGILLFLYLAMGIGFNFIGDLVGLAREMVFSHHAKTLSGEYFAGMLILSVLFVEATMNSSRKEAFLKLLRSSEKKTVAVMLVVHTLCFGLFFLIVLLMSFAMPVVFSFLISAADWAGEDRATENAIRFDFDALALIAMLLVWKATYFLALVPFCMFATVLYGAPAGIGKKLLFILRQKIVHVMFLACYALAYRHYALQLHMPALESSGWRLLLIPSLAAIMLYLPIVWHSCYLTALHPDRIVFRNNRHLSKKSSDILRLKRIDRIYCRAALILLPIALVSTYVL